jgi:hypothetical protein
MTHHLRYEQPCAMSVPITKTSEVRRCQNLPSEPADRCFRFLGHVSPIRWQNHVAHQSSDHTEPRRLEPLTAC